MPTQQLRSKTRFVFLPEGVDVTADLLPEWSYDGSFTSQAGAIWISSPSTRAW